MAEDGPSLARNDESEDSCDREPTHDSSDPKSVEGEIFRTASSASDDHVGVLRQVSSKVSSPEAAT